MKLKILCYSAGLLAATYAGGASVIVSNFNASEDGAYSLFDNSGSLLPALAIDNVRLGVFDSSFDAAGAWQTGDIAALDSNFIRFGAATSLLPDSGIDGVLQATFKSTDEAFAGQQIVLWVSNTDNFLAPLAQHLIFRFDATFNSSSISEQFIALLADAGELIAGGFGAFSHDYGFGAGALPGFSLEAVVVPEPATYALVIGSALAGIAALRRRRLAGCAQ